MTQMLYTGRHRRPRVDSIAATYSGGCVCIFRLTIQRLTGERVPTKTNSSILIPAKPLKNERGVPPRWLPGEARVGSVHAGRCSMSNRSESSPVVATLDDLAPSADYCRWTPSTAILTEKDGADHAPRQVFTGHYVPVKLTPIADPSRAHSRHFFRELGFANTMATSPDIRMFSGDISHVPESAQVGWAGYAVHLRYRIHPAVSVPNRQRVRRRPCTPAGGRPQRSALECS